jgi:glyoxylase-like metal-dependent hydrolase (beta-lactamase superfamily II)
MIEPFMTPTAKVAPDTHALTCYLPVPGAGILPAKAHLIRARQPVLVDTGPAAVREPLMDALRELMDPAELCWIWLTHVDADHVGNLAEVLRLAPRARVVTTFLGMGKLNMHGLPVDRVYLLNPGQELDAGDRRLRALRPPTYDAPETTGLLDTASGALFTADSFGALMSESADTAAAIPPDALRDGMATWTQVDSPWLGMVDEHAFGKALKGVRDLNPSTVLSSHLPPADAGMLDTLIECMAAARKAPAFVGPDQAALEHMMAGAPQA